MPAGILKLTPGVESTENFGVQQNQRHELLTNAEVGARTCKSGSQARCALLVAAMSRPETKKPAVFRDSRFMNGGVADGARTHDNRNHNLVSKLRIHAA
jgi:hypothetical protein